jgi:hypothetical protein
MKKFFVIALLSFLFACNNSNKNTPGDIEKTPPATNDNTTHKGSDNASIPVGSNVKFSVDGKEYDSRASALVTKDKDHLKPGNDYFVILTAPSNEGGTLSLNFLLALTPGVYPVVGMGFQRGTADKGELYGGIMGGKPTLTDYKVNVTDVKDMGNNGMGGHRWSISGTFDDVTIPAMKIMLYDKTKNHPAEIKIEKGSFSNLMFEDNFEELMNKATDKMKKE